MNCMWFSQTFPCGVRFLYSDDVSELQTIKLAEFTRSYEGCIQMLPDLTYIRLSELACFATIDVVVFGTAHTIPKMCPIWHESSGSHITLWRNKCYGLHSNFAYTCQYYLNCVEWHMASMMAYTTIPQHVSGQPKYAHSEPSISKYSRAFTGAEPRKTFCCAAGGRVICNSIWLQVFLEVDSWLFETMQRNKLACMAFERESHNMRVVHLLPSEGPRIEISKVVSET